VSEKAGPVALLEATAEARTLIEELTRLAEELKGRQERLEELPAPSEAALRARTEYLDNVMRDELARAEQRVMKRAEEVTGIARRQQEDVLQMMARLAETDAQRRSERADHGHLRMIVSLLVMLLGGFLAGQVANWRSGPIASAKPPSVEQSTSAPRSVPQMPRRTARQSPKPTTRPAR